MDLKEMTRWRIQFLDAILKPLPERLIDKVPANYTCTPDLCLNLKSGLDWVDTLLDQIRWFAHLFPGKEQCDPDFLEDWSRLYLDMHNLSAYIQAHAVDESAFFNVNMAKVVDFGIRAMNRNRWALDFMRPDQLTTVLQARSNLSSIGYDYLKIYEKTKEDFNQPVDFNFFLNSQVFNQEIDGLTGLSNVNLIGAPTGTGKCLGFGTPVIMVDGSIREVQEIKVGDRVMGPDGKGREVLALGRGKDEMYKVTPTKGDPYTVNSEHLLSLIRTEGSDGLILADGTHLTSNGPHFVEASNLFKSNETAKHCLKGWRPGAVSFEDESQDHPIPPYVLGLWLGDGTSKQPEIAAVEDGQVIQEWIKYAESLGCKVSKYNCQEGKCPSWRILASNSKETRRSPFHEALSDLNLLGNKHIPKNYLITSKEARLEILAGLLDTDGYLYQETGYEISQKNKGIAEAITFICRSLGLAAYMKPQKTGIKSLDFEGLYWRVHISGDCSAIPVRDKKKKALPRSQKKNHLVTGIRVEPIGFGDYYGFVLDGDHQFLLGDWQVTHNTRMSLIASNGHLAFSNEVVPFAPQRNAVFVRTRSQTQAFLKESKRLGLSVSCPISTTLGCTSHNKQTKKFLDNLFALLEKLQDGIKGNLRFAPKDLVLPTRIPIELYPSVAKKSDACQALSTACTNLMDLSGGYGTLESFLDQWKVWCKNKNQDPKFKDLVEYLSSMDLETEQRDAKLYLHADGKCQNCPSNPNCFKKDNDEIEYELAKYGNTENPKAYFNRRMDKDADINKISEDFQMEFGFCGRNESKKSMDTSDVVIFTYNWLIDPSIAQHAYRAMKTSLLKGANPAVAAICDEAHFLYDFNEETSFGFQNLFNNVGNLWHAKIHYMDQETFRVPGVDNPVVPVKSGTVREEFKLVDSSLKQIATFLEKFCSIEEKDNTPANLFCMATGHKAKWYPEGLYSLYVDGFAVQHRADPITTTYNALIEIVNHCDSNYKLYKNLTSENENCLAQMMEDDEDTGEAWHEALDGGGPRSVSKDWVYNTVISWKAGGKKNKVKFARVMNKIQNGTYEALSDSYLFIRDFAAMLREVIYSVGGGTFDDRIMAVSTTSPANNYLNPSNIFDGPIKPAEAPDEKKIVAGLSHYLMLLATVAKSQAREWETAGVPDLVKFYQGGGGIFRGLELRLPFRKEIKASFKVNKPQIQTALRPYPYITFLTGTPADPSVWRTKSGFRYFTQATYPNYKPLDYFSITVDENFELKQATKGESLFKEMARSIQGYSGEELTLVCYPSKLTMKEILTQMPDSYKESCIIESETINLDMIQAYAETNPKGAIHAVISGRFLEGVEFTDEAGNSLVKRAIIVGVPFNPPTEENKQIEAYFSKQFHWDKWQTMDMLMYLPVKFKIRQAIGRTVRNLSDRGNVILLDRRYTASKMLKKSLGLVQ